MQALKTINLRCHQIGDEQIRILCDELRFSKVIVMHVFFCFICQFMFIQSLTTLDLQSNQISATGMQYLSEALRCNKVIWILFLFGLSSSIHLLQIETN